MANTWCEILRIEDPDLERVRLHREAKPYSLLIVALLERGAPMTLKQIADRFEEVHIAPSEQALSSLKRCRPARSPVYRDEDRYYLDPHDKELDLWAFRLDLRPPKVPALEVQRPELAPQPAPQPGPDIPLTTEELDEAWRESNLHCWSAQRLTLAVLDATGGPMLPEEVVDFVESRTSDHALRVDSESFLRRGTAVQILDDGRWAISPEGGKILPSTRSSVRRWIVVVRRRAAKRPDPVALKVRQEEIESQRAAHAAKLAKMRRVLLYGFPAKKPEALALLDVGKRKLRTLVGDELQTAADVMAPFDIICAIDVRALLRKLDIDPGDRRLAELGPPQKTKKLNKRGRTLKITTEMLIQDSCGISRPLGDPKKLLTYLREGQETKLRRRLEANVKSIYAMYMYGRLHGMVRLCWGFLDEEIRVPWVHWDETTLYDLIESAKEKDLLLEIVVGSAPGWEDPWARSHMVSIQASTQAWRSLLIDENGSVIDDTEIQLARIATETRDHQSGSFSRS